MSTSQLILTDHITREVLDGSPGDWTPVKYDHFFVAEWQEESAHLLVTHWKKWGNRDSTSATSIPAFTLLHAIEEAYIARRAWKTGLGN